MQIIVDKDCTNNDLFVSVTNQIENILLKFLEPYTLTTLKYFVIALPTFFLFFFLLLVIFN